MAGPRRKLEKEPARPEESVFPHELRPGDRVIGRDGKVWEVAAPPAVYLQGKMHTIRLRKPGDRSVTGMEQWPAHERVTVRRR